MPRTENITELVNYPTGRTTTQQRSRQRHTPVISGFRPETRPVNVNTQRDVNPWYIILAVYWITWLPSKRWLEYNKPHPYPKSAANLGELRSMLRTYGRRHMVECFLWATLIDPLQHLHSIRLLRVVFFPSILPPVFRFWRLRWNYIGHDLHRFDRITREQVNFILGLYTRSWWNYRGWTQWWVAILIYVHQHTRYLLITFPLPVFFLLVYGPFLLFNTLRYQMYTRGSV